jgi:hypothetical protein
MHGNPDWVTSHVLVGVCKYTRNNEILTYYRRLETCTSYLRHQTRTVIVSTLPLSSRKQHIKLHVNISLDNKIMTKTIQTSLNHRHRRSGIVISIYCICPNIRWVPPVPPETVPQTVGVALQARPYAISQQHTRDTSFPSKQWLIRKNWVMFIQCMPVISIIFSFISASLKLLLFLVNFENFLRFFFL